MFDNKLIVVRGGGDIATGTIHRLRSSGFRVIILEVEYPTSIRRQVSFSEAVYEGQIEIEGLVAVHVKDMASINSTLSNGNIPVLIDPDGLWIARLKPDIVIDGILAKRNIGTTKDMAALTVALGPGFTAGKDVDVVIETMRGHGLGRVIREGSAMADTGVPGSIAGYTKERVIHAPAKGTLRHVRHIGDIVEKGDLIALIGEGDAQVPVVATMDGIIRGLIQDGFPTNKGLKIADIDPRLQELKNCYTISDKARCIAGSVLEVVCFEISKSAYDLYRENRCVI